jgi:hypothetical protein
MITRRKLLPLLCSAAILLMALVALATQPVQVSAAPDATMDWSFIGGNGISTSNGAMTLDSTIGQSISGMPSSSLCTGFPCGLIAWWQNHLPLLIH